jgi:sugar lactone lactonase YvrE
MMPAIQAGQHRRIGTGSDILGEGPIWSAAEQALYWVDIRAPAVRRWSQATDSVQSWDMPEPVGCLFPRAGGGLLVALKSGPALFDPVTGAIRPHAAAPEHAATLRFNDGKCDRQGRLWVGTMSMDERGPVGRLYRLDDRGMRTMLDGITIPNSLCWSPDGRTMYFSDSPKRVIWAFPYDPATGDIGPRRVFAEIEAPMVADGGTVDSEGFLWSANYHGWRVTRFAPDGRVDQTIELPAAQITCCAFGGPNLSTLFITSATQNLTPEALAAQPMAGALMAVETTATGLPEPPFAF